MNNYHIPSFDEYQKLDEGVKSKLAAGLGGLLLAGNAIAGDPTDDTQRFNHTDKIGNNIPSDYTVKQMKDYNSERNFSNTADYKKYEREHNHVIIPSKKNGHGISFSTSYFKHRFTDEEFFFSGTNNNFTNLNYADAKENDIELSAKNKSISTQMNKVFSIANDFRRNGKVDTQSEYLNFHIIKNGKGAYVLNDPLKIAITVKDLDEFFNKLQEYYIVTPIGDTAGDESEIFNGKKDTSEWFNISPKPNMRRW